MIIFIETKKSIKTEDNFQEEKHLRTKTFETMKAQLFPFLEQAEG
jgi:hypothetical protein